MKLVAAVLRVARVTAGLEESNGAYRLVDDSHHLQADCQEPGSAPEPYARQSSMGYLYLLSFTHRLIFMYSCGLTVATSRICNVLLRRCVSDVAEASPTSNAPCRSERLCQSAHIQNLAGCDAAAQSCVCERGYDLERGVCVGQSSLYTQHCFTV